MQISSIITATANGSEDTLSHVIHLVLEKLL